jgi:high frequency lysogenization protein
MNYTDSDRLIALAGIYQAARCVRQAARHGSVDTDEMEPCIHSLFQTDAASVPDVFGAPGAVAAGVRELAGQLSGRSGRELELTRYAISLLKLERVLAGRRVMVDIIAEGIDKIRPMLADAPLSDPSLLERLAELYTQTLSHLQPRIMVTGEPIHLKDPANQYRIRALLLAGIRSAWLWRQVGGGRWRILLYRSRLLQAAKEYLRVVQH